MHYMPVPALSFFAGVDMSTPANQGGWFLVCCYAKMRIGSIVAFLAGVVRFVEIFGCITHNPSHG